MEERTDFWLSSAFYTHMHTRQIQSIFLAYQPGQVGGGVFIFPGICFQGFVKHVAQDSPDKAPVSSPCEPPQVLRAECSLTLNLTQQCVSCLRWQLPF